MQKYETLIIEHDHLDMLAERLSLTVGGRPDVEAAVHARSSLSMALNDHIEREDRRLYDSLIRKRADGSPAAAALFHESFADLAACWDAYLHDWDADCIGIDWASFAEETVMMMERLRARIAEENGLLYRLALPRGRTRLPSAA
ncbi:hemerythrin domain-containing protein [Sphingomonadaceae bacterium G21617-S1]|nr:hemerythrin domain-containing protein [Sphingomonadaceae bacterium G21617-S1]